MAIDAYTQLLAIPAGPRLPDYYRLLGVPPDERDPERIRQAMTAEQEGPSSPDNRRRELVLRLWLMIAALAEVVLGGVWLLERSRPPQATRLC